MAGERMVNRPRVFTLNGYRISQEANEILYKPSRALVDGHGYEDPGARNFKGPYEGTARLAGNGSAAEAKLLESLAASGPAHLIDLWESSPESSPVAAVNSAAFFSEIQIGELSLPRRRGAMNAWSFEAKSELYPYFGKLAYTNIGGSPLGAGTVTSTPINLGALAAGEILGLMFQVVDPPGIAGTGVTINANLESDTTSGFSSPVTQASIAEASAAPSSQILKIDGDIAPTPSETWWRLSITVAGTSPGVTILAAICKRPKL